MEALLIVIAALLNSVLVVRGAEGSVLQHVVADTELPVNETVIQSAIATTTTVTPDVSTEDFQPVMDDAVMQVSKKMLPLATRILSDPNITTSCSGAVMKFFFGLRKFNPWAIHMIDADGRPPSGLFQGTLGDFGDYDECLSIEAKNSYGEIDFRGKYCSFFWNFPPNFLAKIVDAFQEQGFMMGRKNPMKYVVSEDGFLKGSRMGLCIPSVCSGQEIERMVDLLIGKYGFYFNVADCDTIEDSSRNMTGFQYFFICVIVFLICFICFATGFELVLRLLFSEAKTGSPVDYITAFSVISNTQKFLNTEVTPGSDNDRLKCIAGLKFFSALWVILGHTFALQDFNSMRSTFKAIDASEGLFFTFIYNAFPSISTFFFISGFLLCFGMLKTLPKYRGSKPLYVMVLLIRRYIRLTIPFLFAVGVVLLFPLFAHGPLAHDFDSGAMDSCRERWWMLFLQINNWQNFTDICVPFYWYLSVDFQLYALLWIVPFVIIVYKREKLGLILLGAITAAATIFVIIQTSLGEYQPFLMVLDTNERRMKATADHVYVKPFTHVGSYCAGILFAFLVVRYKEIKIGKALQMSFWLLSGSIALLVIMLPHEWMKDNLPTSVEAGFYSGLHRTAWTVALGWLVYACATSRGGIINRFLGWKLFVPLSRLTYGSYLMSVLILTFRFHTRNERVEAEHFPMFIAFFGITCMSFLAAYLFFLLVECPTGNIEKMLFTREKKSSAEDHDNDTTLRQVKVNGNGVHTPINESS